VVDSIALELEGAPVFAPVKDEAVSLLNAACDPVRWTVLRQLSAGQACVCDLQALVDVAPNLLSYHLKVLRDAGLVTTSRRGRWVDYKLATDAASRLAAALPVSEIRPP
jgi:ArsR family transcriptional regulator